jgi:hypothetical protein
LLLYLGYYTLSKIIYLGDGIRNFNAEDDSIVDLDLEDDSELCDTLDANSNERLFQEMLELDEMDFDEELNSEQ